MCSVVSGIKSVNNMPVVEDLAQGVGAGGSLKMGLSNCKDVKVQKVVISIEIL